MRKPKYPAGSGIYAIVNTVNGRTYFGQGAFSSRWPRHRYLLRKGEHYCHELQTEWIEYGEAVFDFRVVERIYNDDYNGVYTDDRERFYIGSQSDAYNGDLVTKRFRSGQYKENAPLWKQLWKFRKDD